MVQMDGCKSCGGGGGWMWGHMVEVDGRGVTWWWRWMVVGSHGGSGWMLSRGCHDCVSREEEVVVE